MAKKKQATEKKQTNKKNPITIDYMIENFKILVLHYIHETKNPIEVQVALGVVYNLLSIESKKF